MLKPQVFSLNLAEFDRTVRRLPRCGNKYTPRFRLLQALMLRIMFQSQIKYIETKAMLGERTKKGCQHTNRKIDISKNYT